MRLGRFGRCFGGCVCYVRVVPIFLFEVTLSGSGLLYIGRFSRCRYDPYVLFGVCVCYVRRRLDILVCGHLVWSCISRDAWKLGVSISVLEFTRCSSVPPFIPWAIVYVSRGQFFVVPLWSLCLPRRLRLLCPAAFGNSWLRSACRLWASRDAWKCPRLSLERSYE